MEAAETYSDAVKYILTHVGIELEERGVPCAYDGNSVVVQVDDDFHIQRDARLAFDFFGCKEEAIQNVVSNILDMVMDGWEHDEELGGVLVEEEG